MTSPYSDLPARSFWKGAVSRRSPETLSGLWQPKFSFARDTRIATAGSCFAQHISRYLRARKAIVVNLERSPPGLSAANAAKYGYGIYSARYGNIYTVRHLLQLTEEALGRFAPSDAVWERDGRFFDLTADPFEDKQPLAVAELTGSAKAGASKLQAALDQFTLDRPAHLSTPGECPGGKKKKKSAKQTK